MYSPRIFISYSHRGDGPKWKTALVNALHLFEQQHLLDVWQDGKIRVSSFWDDDIKQAMSSASLAIILLTKEALESDYIINTEFEFLSKRQRLDKMPIFPIVCEECNWRSFEWLRATQAPNESNPLSGLTQIEQDRVFRKLATDIAEELSRFAFSKLQGSEKMLADEKVFLDKFPLTRGPGLHEEKLIGREQEIALLDLAFVQPLTSIVSLVAWGGVGKSMLVQKWLQRMQHEGWFGMKRVYAWSFFSQGANEDRQASEDLFFSHALDWFGVQCEPTISPWDKGRKLADAIIRESTLLILDSIEPLQYPPGPMGGQMRSQGVQSLLKQLARNNNTNNHNSLCLITTREPLTDLIEFERKPEAAWGSVLRINLGNLTNDAGAALLHHTGVNRAGAAEIKCSDTELVKASHEVDGHALTLNLLGRFLARAHRGDIRRRDLVNFEEADLEEQGGTTFRMLSAFKKWFANEGDIEARALSILQLLGLFDRPADSGCIANLRKHPAIEGLTEPLFILRRDIGKDQIVEKPLSDKAWNDATHFLSDFGLIVQKNNTTEHLLDCHPLIREYFGKETLKENPESCRMAHNRLYIHLITTALDYPNSVNEMELLYQAIYHGCKARNEEEVRTQIYRDRILRGSEHYSWHMLGCFQEELAALSNFFEFQWRKPLNGISESGKSWLFNEAGCCLRALGRLSESIQPFENAVSQALIQQDWLNAAIYSSNLSENYLALGFINNAIDYAQTSIDCSIQFDDPMEISMNLTVLGDAIFQSGQFNRASLIFRKAEVIQANIEPEYPLLYSLQGYRYCDYLLFDVERVAWRTLLFTNSKAPFFEITETDIQNYLNKCFDLFNRCHQLMEWRNSKDSLLTVGLENLILGRAEFYWALLSRYPLKFSTTSLDRFNVRDRINTSNDQLTKTGQQLFTVVSSLVNVWLNFMDGEKNKAIYELNDVFEITSRGNLKLHLADVLLYRARLFYREDNYPWKSPQNDLLAAEKMINECGYHRRDGELADAKRIIIQES